jgi:hypothetical protein
VPAGTSTFQISGVAGYLTAGSRVAAQCVGWSASRQEDGRWRITTERHVADPYWLEHGASFKATLVIGKGEVKGRAEIVSLEPLIFDMEIPDA